MPEAGRCAQCGAPIPADAPAGELCPRCLLREGLPSQTPTQDPGGTSRRFVAPPPERLADRFPNLEILELLGQGGMGAVYKARQKKLERLVALKILSFETARGPAFAERFTREARALARVSHPNIVAIHDFGDADGTYYFVMEYVDGANLREVLRAGTLSPKEALAVVPQLCDALQYAHEEGVVHRDIKPENILLDQRGRVKIADFGLAKMLQPGQKDVTLTVPGEVMGTPAYMAPEQIERPTQVDHRADIFSLGVVFYEMLTGELPLGRFGPPSSKVEIDVRLDEVVLRTLAKEPELRYQSASDVKTDVESLSDPEARPARAPEPAAAAPPPPERGAPSDGGVFVGVAAPGGGGGKEREEEPGASPSAPAAGGPTRTVHVRRPRGVTVCAVWFFLAGAALFSIPHVPSVNQVVTGPISIARSWSLLGAGIWVLLSWFLAAWHIVTGVGLLRLRRWAWTHAIVLSILALMAIFLFPAAFLFAIAVLIYLIRGDCSRLFDLGEGPVTLPEPEARRVERAMGSAVRPTPTAS